MARYNLYSIFTFETSYITICSSPHGWGEGIRNDVSKTTYMKPEKFIKNHELETVLDPATNKIVGAFWQNISNKCGLHIQLQYNNDTKTKWAKRLD